MSGTASSLLGLSLLVVTGLALEFAGPSGRGTSTAAQVLSAAMRCLPGRVLVLGAWLWLGVHFLARYGVRPVRVQVNLFSTARAGAATPSRPLSAGRPIGREVVALFQRDAQPKGAERGDSCDAGQVLGT